MARTLPPGGVAAADALSLPPPGEFFFNRGNLGVAALADEEGRRRRRLAEPIELAPCARAGSADALTARDRSFGRLKTFFFSLFFYLVLLQARAV